MHQEIGVMEIGVIQGVALGLNILDGGNTMSARKETHNTKIFAKRLARVMDELGLNQSALSDLTGIQRQTISLYLKGVTAPAADKLISLAIALHCSTDWLLGLSDYKNSGLVGGNNDAVSALCDAAEVLKEIAYKLMREVVGDDLMERMED